MRLQRCLKISLKNWVINYAVRNGNKVLENHLKTCNKLTSQQLTKMIH